MTNHKYTKELLEPIIKKSFTWGQVTRALGLKSATGAQSHVKKRATEFGIDYSHFQGQSYGKGIVKGYKKLIEVYLNNEVYIGSHNLKIRLIKENIKEPKCEKCGLFEWMKELIPLELDHIDGNHRNNQLDNLQILCANCHALKTKVDWKNKRLIKTHFCLDCYKEIDPNSTRCRSCAALQRQISDRCSKIDWPDVNELIKEVKQTSYVAVAKRLGVSDKAIAKRIKTRG